MPVIPAKLRRAAFTVGEECAWLRQDALRVIACFQGETIAILGIDVWLRGDGEDPVIPTPYIYAWAATPRAHGESEEEYARRTCREAVDYVQGFEWDDADVSHAGRTPYFCVTVDADSW